MELRHLRYFVASAEEQNFSRAAQRLNVAQPALSRRIQALEEDLGFALFIREKKRVRLTAAGSAFFTSCQGVLAELNLAQEHARQIANAHRRKLIVGLNPAAAFSTEIMQVLTEFRVTSADIDTELLTMTSSAQLAALAAGQIDVGFMHVLSTSPDLQTVRICDGRLAIAIHADHPLAKKPCLELMDFREEPFLWVREEEAMFAHGLALGAFHRCGFDPRVVHRISSFETSLALVSAGAGHSLAHSLAAARKPSNVVFRVPVDFDLPLPVMLAWRDASGNPDIGRLRGMFERHEAVGA